MWLVIRFTLFIPLLVENLFRVISLFHDVLLCRQVHSQRRLLGIHNRLLQDGDPLEYNNLPSCDTTGASRVSDPIFFALTTTNPSQRTIFLPARTIGEVEGAIGKNADWARTPPLRP